MKNRFLSTVAAVALLSTGLMAQSVLDITAGNDANSTTAADTDVVGQSSGAVTVAKEVLAGAAKSVDLNGTVNRSIIYIPEINMAQNATIEITMENGVIASTSGNNLYLSDGNASQEIGHMTDFLKNTDNTGYKWMRFQITKNSGLQSGHSAYISTRVDGDAATGALTVIADKGLSKGSNVTAQVTLAKDDNGNTQNAPLTAAEKVIEVTDGILASMAQPITNSIIDVNKDRKKFELDSTTSTSSELNITTASAEVGLALDSANDKYTILVERSNCDGVKKVTFNGNEPSAENNDSAHCKWTWKGDFSGGNINRKVEFEVDGENVLQTGAWKVSVDVEADEVTPAGTVLNVMNKTTLLNWGINGAQFVVPYLNTQSAYGTYLVITNTNKDDAAINLDVYSDKKVKLGQTQTEKSCSNVLLGTVPANSTATFYPADFNTAIDQTPGCANFSTTNDRYLGQFTVIAPENNIHAVAFQKDGANGKRSIPVLTQRLKSAATTDYKGHNWGE